MTRDAPGPYPTRRRVLAGVAGLIGGGTATAHGAPVDAVAASRLIGLMDAASGPQAAALTRAYLAAHAADAADPAGLLATLCRSIGLAPQTVAVAPRAMLDACVEAASRRDFAAGDVVLLDGWCLSRTEARLLALARVA